MKKRYHFEPEIMFPKYAQVVDTVTIPKKSDLMIGGNLNKRKALKDWVIARKMGKHGQGIDLGNGYFLP